MKVEIYSDVACPWCFVGLRRFERALAAYPAAADVEFVFRPFEIDPSTPDEPALLGVRMEKKYGMPVEKIQGGMKATLDATAAAEGIIFNWENAISTNTFRAHRLLWLAERDYGATTQVALKEKLLTAFFIDGGDVGNHDQLADLAAEVGMNRERALAFLASDEGTEEVRTEIATAQARGISAVPTFVFDNQWTVAGAQEASTFLQVLEEVARRTEPSAPTGEACADGSCDISH